MSGFERAALDLAERGYWVFPCKPRTKRPWTANGFKDASRAEKQVLRWWDGDRSSANIGVDLGRSGAVIVDLDSKHGCDPDEAIAKLGLGGDLVRIETGEAPERGPKYPESLEGLRGAQLWFRADHPTSELVIPGMQLRGAGTYAIAPPSIHPSGVLYLGELPLASGLPELPAEVLAAVKRKQGERAKPVEDAIAQGTRHETLMSLAGTMRRRGMGEAEMLAALKVTNEQRCRPPLEEAEVAHIAEVAARYDSGEGPKRGARFLSDLTVEDILRKHPELDREEVEDVEDLDDLRKLLRGDKVPDVIVRLVLEGGTELFHDAEDVPFASFDVGGHTETWPVRSRSFKLHCRRLYYEEEEAAPNGQALTDALGVLEAKALFEGTEHEVYRRVAGADDVVFLDLCNDAWEVMAVDREGWRIVEKPPVRFTRARGMLPLPYPRDGGNLGELLTLARFQAKDWPLVAGFCVGMLHPTGPYPVLEVHGEAGSAKSTACRLVKALVDPASAPDRAAPREVQDLMIAAVNGWTIALDNLSSIPDWLSDSLCRLSTGSGLGKRELYTDSDEVILTAKRPVTLNGIEEVVTRGDLLDRSIVVECLPVSEEERRPEDEIWADFVGAHPRLLGALLDAVSTALRRKRQVSLAKLPRLADFAIWVEAAAPALKLGDTEFLDAYRRNRASGDELAVDGAAIGPAVLKLAEVGFEGTAKQLLERLVEQVTDKETKAKEWPKTPRACSGQLKRIEPNLRRLGVVVERWQKGHDKTRTIALSREVGKRPSASSAPTAADAEPHGNAESDADPADDVRTQADDVRTQDRPQEPHSRADADGADANPATSLLCPDCGADLVNDWHDDDCARSF